MHCTHKLSKAHEEDFCRECGQDIRGGSDRRIVRPFLLYHWSPVERRPQILKRGLRPHVTSRCGQLKPPYVCFSDSPSLAWILSADMTDALGDWDLWMVWSNVPSKLTRRTDLENGRGRPTEFRAHEPIPKSKLWYVGVRSHRPNTDYTEQLST